ncbi:hypothetical protein SUDANB96_05970 [Streptomyces sp. enrichment culture]
MLREDAQLAGALLVVAATLALLVPNDGREPTLLGWTLLIVGHVPAVWRRRAPLPAFLGGVVCIAPYHALDFNHTAPLLVSMTLLFTVAVTGPVLRSVLLGTAVIAGLVGVKFGQGMTQGAQMLRIAGWIVTVLLLGVCTRVYQQYLDSAVERAERAERTREEEARRRVVEERLHVARDLHDLLAHSITLVGVQTSVAAHILNADPDRLDRAAVAKALDDIADTCRSAREELRTTLQVLRSSPDEVHEPLPGLDGIPDLVSAARTAGATVTVDLEPSAPQVPPAVGAAAHRIVQESLTNAVRHGGPGVAVQVRVREVEGRLEVSVTDDGRATPEVPPSASGFGLIGMRERVRSVLGTFEAGPRESGGFQVRATLPLRGAPPDERQTADQPPLHEGPRPDRPTPSVPSPSAPTPRLAS